MSVHAWTTTQLRISQMTRARTSTWSVSRTQQLRRKHICRLIIVLVLWCLVHRHSIERAFTEARTPILTYWDIGSYGRLGNQLYQFSATLGTAKKYGYRLCFTKSIQEIDLGRLFALSGLCKLSHQTKPDAWLETHEIGFEEISLPVNPTAKVTSLRGYFQDVRYFEDHTLELSQFLKFRPSVIEEVQRRVPEVLEPDSVAVHIRRQDYLMLSDIYNILDTTYYLNALNILEPAEVVIIVTDDKEWCKKYLVHKIKTRVVMSPFSDPLLDFVLLHLARKQVSANSSFSWWAAFLHIVFGNAKRPVVFPKIWMKNTSRLGVSGYTPSLMLDWKSI